MSATCTPRVVDVVLDFDRRAAKAQHARERVAERGVPQMADVRGLVRVDRRVLDDGLVALGAARPARRRGAQRDQKNGGRSR